MNFADFKKWLEEKGIDVSKMDDATLQSIYDKIGNEYHQSKRDELKVELTTQIKADLEKEKEKNPTTPEPKPEESEVIKALKAEIQTLTEALGEMKRNSDDAKNAAIERAKQDRETKVAKLKQQGIDEGRITEATWLEKWKEIAEKDPDQFEKVLPGLAVDPTFKKEENSDSNTNTSDYKGPLDGADSNMVNAMSQMDKK